MASSSPRHDYHQHLTKYPKLFWKSFPSRPIRPITMDELSTELTRLNPKKAQGFDSISNKHLQCHSLSLVFFRFLQNCCNDQHSQNESHSSTTPSLHQPSTLFGRTVWKMHFSQNPKGEWEFGSNIQGTVRLPSPAFESKSLRFTVFLNMEKVWKE